MPVVLPLLLGIGAAGVSALSKPKAPGAPSTIGTETQQANAATAAAEAQAGALMKRRGLSSTMLTNPMGAMGSGGTRATLGA